MKFAQYFLLIAVTMFSGLTMAGTVFQQDGVAIKGYDPVAYHLAGKPIKGDSQYSHSWEGTIWHFSSQANKQLFVDNPDKYAPQYGGYCAFAASKGSLAPVDPEVWTIHDDKLYLNYSSGVSSKWKKDMDGYIMKADANWPELSSQ